MMDLGNTILTTLFVGGSAWLLSMLPSELRDGKATFRSYSANRIGDPVNYWLMIGIKPVLAAVGMFLAVSFAINPL